MSNRIQILSEYKNALIAFFDELISQFPEEGDLVIIRIFFNDQICIQDVMDLFNHKINKDDKMLKKMVKDRNEKFFLEHNVFDALGKDKVNHFKRLWRSGNLDDDDKDMVWKWIDSFVYLGDKYLKVVSNDSTQKM